MRCLTPLLLLLLALPAFGTNLFHASFTKPLESPWKWIREDPAAWRVRDGAIEVRVQPGNMWGPANDARNVLTYPAPDPGKGKIEIRATVENRPTEQYEQADLVWYYADSHMVKVGLELVDGKLSVVMGREENDHTRTMSINPVRVGNVELRLVAGGGRVAGYFRESSAAVSAPWQSAGECSLPVLSGATPQVSLQFYQGPSRAEHWARVTGFRIQKE